MNFVLLVLALFVSNPIEGDRGSIWVRTGPGVTVSVDGVVKGVTSDAEAGLTVIGVKSGKREVTLSIAGGPVKRFHVDVRAGQTSTVNVPALTFRARSQMAKGAIEIRMRPHRSDCVARVGATALPFEGRRLRIDDLAAVRQQVSVTCGARSVRGEVVVASERVLEVEADFVRERISILGDRPRVLAVEVGSSRDKILNAPIAPDAKRALLTAVPGVDVVSIEARANGRILVTFEAAHPNHIAEQVEVLANAPGIESVEMMSVTSDGRVRGTVAIVAR
ncbi:MAG TPA: hypothetical protein VF057_00640 [Thermoanaerobaculia bacterium]